jgi:hypothetical protein
VKAVADSYSIPNHIQNGLTEATRNALGKEAGRALGLLLLPEQILRTLPGAVTDALVSASERSDNLDNVVGIPLGAAIKQARQYDNGKGKPVPDGLQRLLSLTFEKDHLASIRYVVDSDGGNIAALINSIKKITGDQFDDNHAVAIDDIIVFSREPGGVSDLYFPTYGTVQENGN